MTNKNDDSLANPFARFGVKHLSATSMLQFRNDPALGIVYLVLGIREVGSPAMHRGTVVDEAIGRLLTETWNNPALKHLNAPPQKSIAT